MTISSQENMFSEAQKQKKLHLILISVHGLIRGDNLELGRDADTGGQTKYVVELAKSLGEQDNVARVDLVTRLIEDKDLSDDYSQPVESLSDNVNIIRLSTSNNDYLPKEQLWDYLDHFADNLAAWITQNNFSPDLIHSHYADAGYVGVSISNLFNIPLVHTGHSLGRDKRKRLLAKGLNKTEIENTYKLSRRIEAEENVLANADLVIASTNNEIEEQYGLYNCYDPSRMTVIPPGTDLERFYPPDNQNIGFIDEIAHFFVDKEKPMILALSRPDERKNILSLIHAYGNSKALQEQSNLLIVAGTRDDINDLDKGAKDVFKNILLLIDKYDLYGKVAIPKSHLPEQVPDIYRMVSLSKGVFINPALTEPFGLTILEAAACGLPIVATENGGPVDIIASCDCGTLVDPLNPEEIAQALLNYIENPEQWQQTSHKGITGVKKHYSWQTHAEKYISKVIGLQKKYITPVQDAEPLPKGLLYPEWALCSDIDLSLVGDNESLSRLAEHIKNNRKQLSFMIATGRRVDSALSVMKANGIPRPDVLISSLGTRIQYGQQLIEDDVWLDHIEYDWAPRRIVKLLENLPGLKRQPKHEQTRHKIAYFYDENKAPSQQEIVSLLHQNDITANVVCSFGQFLDVIPSRASKGQAMRYVAQRLEIPLENILVSGGSGSDEDMMRGNPLAVVVANRHDEELAQLDEGAQVYFSDESHAAGILDALRYYKFLDDLKDTNA